MVATLKSALISKRARHSALVGLGALAMCGSAFAGNTGNEWQGFFNLVLGWTTGFLGKALAITAFLIGAGFGVATQSILPAVLGIVFAVVFAVGPGVITSMLTGVI